MAEGRFEEVGNKIFNLFHQLTEDEKIRLIATLAIFESKNQKKQFFKVDSNEHHCIIATGIAATEIMKTLRTSKDED